MSFSLQVVRALDTTHKIMLYLSQNRIPRVHQLLAVALRAGRSMGEIMQRCAAAVAGTYSPKGYTQEDYDLAVLAWRLGGSRLLHALGKHDAFQHIDTLAAKVGHGWLLRGG
jgi:hypothetical protein